MKQATPQLLRALPLIRISMLVSVLLIGGILWFVGEAAGQGQPDPAMQRILNIVFLITLGVVACVVIIIRNKLEATDVVQAQGQLVLAAWATIEGLALLGAVLIFFGLTYYFIFSFMVLLLGFKIFPVPRVDGQNAHKHKFG